MNNFVIQTAASRLRTAEIMALPMVELPTPKQLEKDIFIDRYNRSRVFLPPALMSFLCKAVEYTRMYIHASRHDFRAENYKLYTVINDYKTRVAQRLPDEAIWLIDLVGSEIYTTLKPKLIKYHEAVRDALIYLGISENTRDLIVTSQAECLLNIADVINDIDADCFHYIAEQSQYAHQWLQEPMLASLRFILLDLIGKQNHEKFCLAKYLPFSAIASSIKEELKNVDVDNYDKEKYEKLLAERNKELNKKRK